REVDPPRPSLRLKTLSGEELTTMARVRRTEPAKLPGTLRGDIDWIVMKCIEKDRKRRYDTANALAMDLQRHLRNEVVTARPPTAGYLFGKLVRRNKLVFAAGAAIAASLIVGTAVSAWQAVRAEREYKRANATLDALRATAPAFAAQATTLTVQERFEEALEKLHYAAQLQPHSPEHWLAIGDLLQCQLRFRAAAAAYRTAEQTGKADDRARRNAELSDRLEAVSVAAGGRLPRGELANLFESMTNERRSPAELMPIARLLQREGNIALDYWRQRLRSLPINPVRPLENRLGVRPDGLLELDLSGTEISDLQSLAGMPLAKLNLSGCRAITSISPLRGLPLVDLDLDSTEVADLTPLRGMHLESLSLANIQATDLSALAELPLRNLDCSNLSASDFGVLARKPLETLILSGSRVRDASFLEGLPLRKLSLAGANEVRGLKSLTSLRSLDTLILPHNFYEFPVDDLQAIRAIMDLPSVQRVSSSRADGLRLSGVGTREKFLEEWAADLRWLHKLRQTGVEPILLRLPDRTWEVDLRSQPLRDLSSLQGAPIGRLVLSSVPVSDLRPLSGMQLRVLDLCRTEVRDLSPIRGMPLRRLYLWRVQAEDFSPLSTLPNLELLDLSETQFRDLNIISSRKLRELRIGSSLITDLAPLAGWPLERLHADSIAVTTIEPLLRCPTLKWIIPPQSARDLTRLKELPDLQKISFRWREGSEPIDTAPQFWKDYKP
ncbi:MAG TPA: hypothetical protein VFG14_09520, partial [Chthoniobacteraceae bacterium]|nr:hypothetical protein [Chthoniobacteraceae bacterium]